MARRFQDQEEQVSEEDEKEEEGPACCNWCPCATIANFGVPAFEECHHKVLGMAHCLSFLGVILTVIAFWGGWSGPGFGLRHFKWLYYDAINADGSTTSGVAGVRLFCNVAGTLPPDHPFANGTSWMSDHGEANCRKWSDLDCSKLSAGGKDKCELCSVASSATYVPAIIACITYVLLFKNTHARYEGKDSNKTKVSCFISCFVGGSNFLGTLKAYTTACLGPAESSSGIATEIGLGLKLMIAAALLKLVVGLLHLSLPVKRGKDPEDSTDEESEAE